MSIQTKHVYDPPAQIDGARFLVDRLWPRGMKKESLRTDVWLKGVAPTKALRKWFAHDPEKWPEFKRRYAKELNAHPDAWEPLLDAARKKNVTLLYSARDTRTQQRRRIENISRCEAGKDGNAAALQEKSGHPLGRGSNSKMRRSRFSFYRFTFSVS